MSSPMTVILNLHLRSGVNIEDQSSPPGKTWQNYLITLAAQKGFRRVYWGRQLESANLVDLFVDWDSFQDCENSAANTTHQTLREAFASFLEPDTNVRTYHTHFSPQPPSSNLSATSTSAAEVLTFYFPSNLSDHDRSSGEYVMETLTDALRQYAEGFITSSTGWVVEELQHESPVGTATAYISVIEWESVEKHRAFKETEAFIKVIGPIRDATTGAELHHTIFQGVIA